MAITITWIDTLVEDETSYKLGKWYLDGVLSGNVHTPLDTDFNQLFSDEQLIAILEPVDY